MKSATKDLAAKIVPTLVVEGNQIKDTPESYEATLPETFGETAKEQSTGVHAHDKGYISAFSLAVGEKAVDVLKDNHNFASVTGEGSVGNSKLTVVVERNATVSAGPAKEGETPKTREVQGYTTVRVSTKGGTEVKHVRDHIADLAAKAL